jgi:DNA-binding CsgD family transcriptional regulator
VREQAVGKLTPGQKDCLRLVQRGFEAKEIARLLGTSPGAVVERLRAARRTLDVATSRAAARLLAEVEAGDAAYNRDVANPIGLVGLADDPMLPGSMPRGSAGAGQGGISLREEQSPYRFERLSVFGPLSWPFPVEGRRRNDLTIKGTAVTVLALTIGLGLAALIAIMIVDQLSRLKLP